MGTPPDEVAKAQELGRAFVVVPTNERVATIETRLEIFLEEQFPAFRQSVTSQFDAVTKQFGDVKDQISHISPNGQTPRLIEIGKAVGDPDQVQALQEIADAHIDRKRIFHPLRVARNTFLNTLVYAAAIGTAAAAGAYLHPFLHAAFSWIP